MTFSLKKKKYRQISLTEENNSYNTITTLSDTGVVNEIKSLLSDYNFGDVTIKAISAVAGYDLEKCNRAKALMEQQNKDIANPAGWLIAALKNNYLPAAEYEKRTPPQKNDLFNLRQP